MNPPLPRRAQVVSTVFACGFAVTVACGLARLPSTAAAADVEKHASVDQLEVVRSTLFDAEMVLLEVAGHKAFILKPPQPKTEGPKPWVWYAPTLLGDREQDWISPGERHAWMFTRLLGGGFYVVGVDVGESWGSPAGRTVYDEFYAPCALVTTILPPSASTST